LSSLGALFTAHFDPTNQEILLAGKIRPERVTDIADLLELVRRHLEEISGIVYLNVKRLTHINMTAFNALSAVLATSCRAKPHRKVVVVTSSVVAWSTAMFERLADSEQNLSVQVYDSAFYPGQRFVEDESFIPLATGCVAVLPSPISVVVSATSHHWSTVNSSRAGLWRSIIRYAA
jgi:hypothetical protein